MNQHYDNGTFKGSGASTTYKYTGDDHFAWYDIGTRQFTWHYDALGRQIARTRAGSGGASDIHIYYDGVDDVEVTSWTSSTETQTRRMVYGERINELLEHTDYAGPTSYYAHADKLDSVMLLAKADGSIAESYRYTDYGQPTVVDDTFAKLTTLNSNIGNWKRYTGQEHAMPSSVADPWYFYRARAYRADAGKFVQRDPLHYIDGNNQYAYVANTPLARNDPLGLGDTKGEVACDPPDGSQVDSWEEHCKCEQGEDYKDAETAFTHCAEACGAAGGVIILGGTAVGGPIGFAIGVVAGAVVSSACLNICIDSAWKDLKAANRQYKYCLAHPRW